MLIVGNTTFLNTFSILAIKQNAVLNMDANFKKIVC